MSPKEVMVKSAPAWISLAISAIVAATVLGMAPRCDQIMTRDEAGREHDALSKRMTDQLSAYRRLQEARHAQFQKAIEDNQQAIKDGQKRVERLLWQIVRRGGRGDE